MLVVGLVLGFLPRTWRNVGIAVAAFGWAVLLIVDGTLDAGVTTSVVFSVVFAAANVFVGVAVANVIIGLWHNIIRQL